MHLPKKSATCGLVQIGESGLYPVLAETSPTGESQAKKDRLPGRGFFQKAPVVVGFCVASDGE